MRRYKTIQELGGLPAPLEVRYGEPLQREDKLTVRDLNTYTTELPHPFDNKRVKVNTHGDRGVSEMVQEKAFALGYTWGPYAGWSIVTKHPFLFFNGPGMLITHVQEKDVDYFNEHKAIELTPQEFMDGFLPDAGVTVIPEKLDAYVDDRGVVHILNSNGKTVCYQNVQDIEKHLYVYNWISQEDFEKKYHKPLKFKKWEVTVEDKHIRVGCETFRKSELEQWMRTGMCILNEHKVQLEDAYKFLYVNKKELDLNF